MFFSITTPTVKNGQLGRINKKSAATSINDEVEVLLRMSGSRSDVTAHAIRATKDGDKHRPHGASTLR
jgi:hypothetical protein